MTDSPDLDHLAACNVAAPPSPNKHLPDPSAGRTILLVDDDTALRDLTGSYLKKKGYNVVSCGNAELAGDVVKSEATIDLLITDVDMPRRSGMELGIEMKQLRPAVPVLLISGGFLTGDSSERVRARGWNLLDKPFRLGELLDSVHLLLDKTHEA